MSSGRFIISSIFAKYLSLTISLTASITSGSMSVFLSDLLQSGVNLVYIRDLLGHSDISTTEIYARADEKMKRKALMEAYSSPASDELPTWKKVLFYKILIGCYRLSAYTCARIPITSFFIYFSSFDLFIL